MSNADVLSNLGIVDLQIRTDGTGSLMMKLVEITDECRGLPKRGYNERQNYHYATEADVSEYVAPKMAKRKLMMIPNVAKHDVIKLAGRNGSEEILWTGVMTFTVVDAETGERMTFSMTGQGADNRDKAAFKGQTGAQKYALLKLFQIPTGLDPENDGDAGGRSAGAGSGGDRNQSQGNGQPANAPGGRQSNGRDSGRPSAPNGGRSAGSGQPGASGGRNGDTAPGYKKAVELAQAIGWDAKAMMQAVNDLRRSHGMDPVERWLDLEPAFRNQFFDKMKRRRDGGGQQRQDDGRRGSGPAEGPPVPTQDDLVDGLTMAGMDYGDFIRWMNRFREIRNLQPVRTWEELSDEWKQFGIEKLHKRARGEE